MDSPQLIHIFFEVANTNLGKEFQLSPYWQRGKRINEEWVLGFFSKIHKVSMYFNNGERLGWFCCVLPPAMCRLMVSHKLENLYEELYGTSQSLFHSWIAHYLCQSTVLCTCLYWTASYGWKHFSIKKKNLNLNFSNFLSCSQLQL